MFWPPSFRAAPSVLEKLWRAWAYIENYAESAKLRLQYKGSHTVRTFKVYLYQTKNAFWHSLHNL